jgi:hypothetical protein
LTIRGVTKDDEPFEKVIIALLTINNNNNNNNNNTSLTKTNYIVEYTGVAGSV